MYPPFAAATCCSCPGQIPQQDGKPTYLGKLGEEIALEEGKQAAALCALGILAHVSAAVDGDMDRVRRVVRLGVFVASTPDFDQQSQVGNGASDLIAAVFGERGRHARTAVGVASLPRGPAPAAVTDAIIEHLRREVILGPMEAAAAVADRIDAVYRDAAALLGCDRDELADHRQPLPWVGDGVRRARLQTR